MDNISFVLGDAPKVNDNMDSVKLYMSFIFDNLASAPLNNSCTNLKYATW